ncbi:SDR family NAD(P)-dependent oxidoreductase [Roseitranquillus sediminis]|uniref:SDR family NAD(P)-dependent oxidoreductase n=1 Tax=Roseitranquillus sediminis TaxID=2809051 RepID=UPI001D0CB6E8|nr:SDR family oxidoreductase [Roseitranquillus sediminis]MBM9595904.1 SDR family oxidoreductase [Roseitranquillus sediminis]
MDRDVMERDLAGKTAFVSGSGRNIGRSIVLELARRGCNVIVNGSSDRAACGATAEAASATGAGTLVAMGDVSRAEDVARISREAVERFGAVDILVNNAAVRPHKPFLENTFEDWRKVLALDLDASFLTCRAFAPAMVERGWGRIIGMTGMKAMHGYFEGAPISAAKHGVWGLTKALAKELGPHGVTVNAISPGPIRKEDEAPGGEAPVPLGHKGDPEDIAGIVGFLAGEGGRFVTGQMIAVNGGGQT